MQCIALAIKHLPITHLEILTLAYPAMNFVTYIFWWNKPLNVNRPVRVFQKLVTADISAWSRCLFWCDSLHCLAFSISDSNGAVDLANIECCDNCRPHLYAFDGPFG